ncbi:MAG: hypothetical protein ACYSO7_11555 [Planctomycetota bacterium]
MKNLLALLCVLAVIGTASAALVNNGDFEDSLGTAAFWEFATSASFGTPGEEPTGGNPDGNVTIETPDNMWAVWYQSISEKLDVLGIPAEETVTFSVDIKNLSGNLVSGGLKAESWNGDVGSLSDSGDQLFTTTTSWATYTYDYTLFAGADALKFVLLNVNYGNTSGAKYAYDNAEISVAGKALYPSVPVGGTELDTATELTWENPAGTISTIAAYLLESDVPLNDPNMGPTVFEPGVQTLTVTGESADVTGLLTADKYYYWAVHVNGGQGYTWDFLATGDTPPIVDAGADQYLVTDGLSMTLNLDATVTDDEDAGPVSISWSDNTVLTDKDPNTVVTINSPTTEDTTVSLVGDVATTGYYQFEITVDDGFNDPVTDQVVVVVYPTCAEAAAGDPLDGWTSVGDIDGDCKANLTDFALFAAAWLDCNSNRVTCP